MLQKHTIKSHKHTKNASLLRRVTLSKIGTKNMYGHLTPAHLPFKFHIKRSDGSFYWGWGGGMALSRVPFFRKQGPFLLLIYEQSQGEVHTSQGCLLSPPLFNTILMLASTLRTKQLEVHN